MRSFDPPHSRYTTRTSTTRNSWFPYQGSSSTFGTKNLQTTTTNIFNYIVCCSKTTRRTCRVRTCCTKHNDIVINRKFLCIYNGVCTVECNRSRKSNTRRNMTRVLKDCLTISSHRHINTVTRSGSIN